MNKYLACAKLNWQMFKNVIAERWLNNSDFENGYDSLAEHYDSNWLIHLKSVTSQLLDGLPLETQGSILDLGCGTGYTTQWLEQNFPDNEIAAVDISSGMLDQAKKICQRSRFYHDDMLDFMQSQPSNSAGMIVSGWAVGYSNLPKLLNECARVLTPGGRFAFVVNYADTLEPVFYAYKHCMAQFPGKVKKALNVHFPQNWQSLEKLLSLSCFTTEFKKEGCIAIAPPTGKSSTLNWLLKTGTIAGFDKVLPLAEDNEIADFFEQKLRECPAPLEHQYIIYSGVKN
ncbi:MAG: class I SAM-dependent methyltransferase [Lentisphaerae bacterium]|nr:class I SAM-dependent methyltransferase [Lentisphaerota bacterium]MCP4103001.1 class I SAM-dependent methyltransferase [Lentisphaerota bacterium]